MSDPQTLAKKLSGLTFMDVFQRPGQPTLDLLWSGGRNQSDLESIARDPAAEPLARFLAAEILFRKVPGLPPETLGGGLADAYAAALAENYTGMANPWGLPGLPDGETAQHVVQLGEAAVPTLRRLLDDDRAVHYGGSKEATFGNRYQYRVKDLAAALIARIRNTPFPPDENPAARDRAIERLVASL